MSIHLLFTGPNFTLCIFDWTNPSLSNIFLSKDSSCLPNVQLCSGKATLLILFQSMNLQKQIFILALLVHAILATLFEGFNWKNFVSKVTKRSGEKRTLSEVPLPVTGPAKKIIQIPATETELILMKAHKLGIFKAFAEYDNLEGHDSGNSDIGEMMAEFFKLKLSIPSGFPENALQVVISMFKDIQLDKEKNEKVVQPVLKNIEESTSDLEGENKARDGKILEYFKDAFKDLSTVSSPSVSIDHFPNKPVILWIRAMLRLRHVLSELLSTYPREEAFVEADLSTLNLRIREMNIDQVFPQELVTVYFFSVASISESNKKAISKLFKSKIDKILEVSEEEENKHVNEMQRVIKSTLGSYSTEEFEQLRAVIEGFRLAFIEASLMLIKVLDKIGSNGLPESFAHRDLKGFSRLFKIVIEKINSAQEDTLRSLLLNTLSIQSSTLDSTLKFELQNLAIERIKNLIKAVISNFSQDRLLMRSVYGYKDEFVKLYKQAKDSKSVMMWLTMKNVIDPFLRIKKDSEEPLKQSDRKTSLHSVVTQITDLFGTIQNTFANKLLNWEREQLHKLLFHAYQASMLFDFFTSTTLTVDHKVLNNLKTFDEQWKNVLDKLEIDEEKDPLFKIIPGLSFAMEVLHEQYWRTSKAELERLLEEAKKQVAQAPSHPTVNHPVKQVFVELIEKCKTDLKWIPNINFDESFAALKMVDDLIKILAKTQELKCPIWFTQEAVKKSQLLEDDKYKKYLNKLNKFDSKSSLESYTKENQDELLTRLFSPVGKLRALTKKITSQSSMKEKESEKENEQSRVPKFMKNMQKRFQKTSQKKDDETKTKTKVESKKLSQIKAPKTVTGRGEINLKKVNKGFSLTKFWKKTNDFNEETKN